MSKVSRRGQSRARPHSLIEKRFLKKMGSSWQGVTPGLRLQAHLRGKKIIDVGLGEVYPYYDWASVSKIVFTVTALMMKQDEKILSVNDPVSRWIPWFPEANPARLRDLLTHSAGMTWWYPFYKSLSRRVQGSMGPEDAWTVFEGKLRRRVLLDLKKNPRTGRSAQAKTVYSDLDFFLLGLVLEAAANAPLYEVWSVVRERLKLDHTDFHRQNRPTHQRKLYAPTEDDKSFRGKLLQGEVHDQNTWSLQGVAPHAGLFGPIDDLSRWGLKLRESMLGHAHGIAAPSTVRLFTKRALPRARGDWALGFMMPSKGSASCGPLFSPRSVGHTGYTGTSLWFDPRRDLLVTILSNRIHPTVENIEIRTLRPKIHTWIAEEL